MRLNRGEQSELRAICEELSTVRAADPPALSWVTKRIAALIGARATTAYGLAYHSNTLGFDFGYFEGDLPRDVRDRQIALWNSPGYSWVYNPLSPQREQRNKVVSTGTLLRGPSRENVLRLLEDHKSAGIDLSGQVRVLVCDGPSLLAYVGAYHEDEKRSAHVVSHLVGPLQKRLRLERQLAGAPLLESALTAALEQISAAAFIIGARGVLHANSSGKALLSSDDRASASLWEIANGRRGELEFEVTKLISAGSPPYYMALLRAPPEAPSLRAAWLGQRWALTRRQTEVLGLLAQGLANKTLAATLGCTEDTIEQHVRALFDKAGVDSRSALVAMFWTAR